MGYWCAAVSCGPGQPVSGGGGSGYMLHQQHEETPVMLYTFVSDQTFSERDSRARMATACLAQRDAASAGFAVAWTTGTSLAVVRTILNKRQHENTLLEAVQKKLQLIHTSTYPVR